MFPCILCSVNYRVRLWVLQCAGIDWYIRGAAIYEITRPVLADLALPRDLLTSVSFAHEFVSRILCLLSRIVAAFFKENASGFGGHSHFVLQRESGMITPDLNR